MNVRVLASLCCGVVLGISFAQARTFRAGLLYQDVSKVAPEHEVKSVPIAPGARSFRDMPRVDLSDEVPPIGNQGDQGSCLGWAVAYYHRSQLEYRERHWDLTDRNHQFSPAFTYNQVNGGADNGSYFVDHMALIKEQGCASMADCPYNQNDCITWPSESAYSHALPFRCRDWAYFLTLDTGGLSEAKQLLNNGSTLVLGIWIWDNFLNISSFGNIYCVADRRGSNPIGHGVTIVGYDDTLTTRDGPGAFRLANSMGIAWGDSGFFWMSYVAVMDSFLSQRTAFFLSDTVGYEPEFLGRVRIEHAARDRVAIGFHVGPAGNPLWYHRFRQFYRPVTQDHPFPAHNLVFDLTEAAPYIANRQTDSAYGVAWDERPGDSISGTVRYFSAQYLPWGNLYGSGVTPLQIPDDGSVVYAGARIEHHDLDVTPAVLLSPPRVVAPESSYVPRVAVYNFGLLPASFPVRLTIGGSYRDSAQVTGLAPTESVHVSFRSWTAPSGGDVTLRCSTALAGDEYPANDTCVVLLRSRMHDVAVVEILIPPDTVDSGVSIRPTVTVRNNGTQTETFIATFRIPDEGYNRPAQAALPPDSVGIVAFANWVPRLSGYHALSCTLSLAGDQNDTNNLIRGGVVVRGTPGVAEGAPAKLEPTRVQTVTRGRLFIMRNPALGEQAATWLLDIAGRRALVLHPGVNDVRHLAPGVYFAREEGPMGRGVEGSRVWKVIVTK